MILFVATDESKKKQTPMYNYAVHTETEYMCNCPKKGFKP